MRALLDTHAVLWAVENDPRLGSSASSLLKSLKSGEAVISDITLLEIAMLVRKGRIQLAISPKAYLRKLQVHFPILAIGADIAALAMDLDLPQGDPFDRIIVATAQVHDLPVLTRDKSISASGLVRVIW